MESEGASRRGDGGREHLPFFLKLQPHQKRKYHVNSPLENPTQSTPQRKNAPKQNRTPSLAVNKKKVPADVNGEQHDWYCSTFWRWLWLGKEGMREAARECTMESCGRRSSEVWEGATGQGRRCGGRRYGGGCTLRVMVLRGRRHAMGVRDCATGNSVTRLHSTGYVRTG